MLLMAIPAQAVPQGQGLADLQRALQDLRSHAPLRLNVAFTLYGRNGDGEDLQEREGALQLQLEKSPSGLSLHYPAATVAQLHAEELAKVDNEDVKNSALNAIGPFDYWEWRELVYPVEQLELMLARYEFVDETASHYDGQPARLLRFSMPKERVEKRYRKYLKKYHNQLELWIDAQGVPLASAKVETGTGRIFLVVGFRVSNQVQMQYQRLGNRLITLRREVNEVGEGATMHGKRHFTSVVTIASGQ